MGFEPPPFDHQKKFEFEFEFDDGNHYTPYSFILTIDAFYLTTKNLVWLVLMMKNYRFLFMVL